MTIPRHAVPTAPSATDAKALRMQVSADEARKTEEARSERKLREKREAIELKTLEETKALELEDTREDRKARRIEARKTAKAKAKQARETEKTQAKQARKQAREALGNKIKAKAPVIGQRVIVAGPIIAPMAVAWVGQVGFARDILHWPFLAGLIFAAAWELSTVYCGWLYHRARAAGDRGTLFRIATFAFAGAAATMNYWHATKNSAGAFTWEPTPKAVAYGAMSLAGIALWELYEALAHREALRDKGMLPPPMPRFGWRSWSRFPRDTARAWSYCVREGERSATIALETTRTITARKALAVQRSKDPRWHRVLPTSTGAGRGPSALPAFTVEVIEDRSTWTTPRTIDSRTAITAGTARTTGTGPAPAALDQRTTDATDQRTTDTTDQRTTDTTDQRTTDTTDQRTNLTESPRGTANMDHPKSANADQRTTGVPRPREHRAPSHGPVDATKLAHARDLVSRGLVSSSGSAVSRRQLRDAGIRGGNTTLNLLAEILTAELEAGTLTIPAAA